MNEITQRECKFAIHVPTRNIQQQPDVHIVKERLTFADGTTKSNLRTTDDTSLGNYHYLIYV